MLNRGEIGKQKSRRISARRHIELGVVSLTNIRTRTTTSPVGWRVNRALEVWLNRGSGSGTQLNVVSHFLIRQLIRIFKVYDTWNLGLETKWPESMLAMRHRTALENKGMNYCLLPHLLLDSSSLSSSLSPLVCTYSCISFGLYTLSTSAPTKHRGRRKQ